MRGFIVKDLKGRHLAYSGGRILLMVEEEPLLFGDMKQAWRAAQECGESCNVFRVEEGKEPTLDSTLRGRFWRIII